MKIIALLLFAIASGSCGAQQQQVHADGQKDKGSSACDDSQAKCVIVICSGMFRATDLINPNGKEYIVPDAKYYTGPRAGFGAVEVAGPLPGNGKITVSYDSNFQGQGEVLTISKDNPDGTTISAMSNSQSPSGALIWGRSQGSAKNTWEIYCKKAL
jgi:hypothetical protein